jgi:hypothetical protein
MRASSCREKTNKCFNFILLIFILALAPVSLNAQVIHNYVFFGMDREKISNINFLSIKNFEGAQLKYTWKELEPQKNKYDFSEITKDLKFLNNHNKKLFLQIQDSTFSINRKFVPSYILNKKEYNGGAVIQYSFNDDESSGIPEGWVAKRWNPKVAERFHKLLVALGEKFNGKVAGINLPETAIGVSENKKFKPNDFTYSKYRDAIIENMKVIKKAFPDSAVIQYVNFMPGEYLPWTDKSYLRSIFNYANKNNIGVGGPDLFPYKKGFMNNTYNFIHNINGNVTVSVAAQDGNYSYIDPKTKKKIKINAMYDFAKSYLKTDYIFWCTEEPYFDKEVVPFIKNLKS